MAKTYGIIANCNFESRDDAEGQAIHAARKAVEAGRCDDQELVDRLDDLEQVLTEHADSDSETSVRMCAKAELRVASRWGILVAAE